MSQTITLRIPTSEQYAYVEICFDPQEEMTADNVRKAYDEYTLAFRGKQGLSEREFNDFLDNVMNDGNNHIDALEKLNDIQEYVYQSLKRAKARKAYKTSANRVEAPNNDNGLKR